jgi:hypothetical protein
MEYQRGIVMQTTGAKKLWAMGHSEHLHLQGVRIVS